MQMDIVHPPMKELLTKVDSRYTLVCASAKRARELIDNAQPLVDPKDRKPVSVAVDEINRGLLEYHRNIEDEDN